VTICLAGDGWGALAALNSLQREYTSLSLVSNDRDLVNMLRDSDEVVQNIQTSRFDLVICAGYRHLVPASILQNQRILNIHYSLLPKYRGMHSTVWAILNGEDKLGLTMHLMNEFMDDGDIIHQHEIEYTDQTSLEIMNICNEHVDKHLGLITRNFLSNNFSPIPQDRSNATWVAKRNINDCLIDFNWSCAFMRRFFKALVKPYPLPMIVVNSNIYQVAEADIINRNYLMTPGRVVNIDADGVYIKLSDGLLLLRTLVDATGVNIDPRIMFRLGQRL
jgi:methionyl-tRNA formyltransferase